MRIKLFTRATFKSVSRRAKWILNTTLAIAGVNFVVFWVGAVYRCGGFG